MTAPAVEAQRSGYVDLPAEGLQQGMAQRLAGGAEGDAADDGAVAGAQLQADVPARTDLPGLDEAVMRKNEDGLGLTGAEGSRALDRRRDGGQGRSARGSLNRSSPLPTTGSSMRARSAAPATSA